jgi:hypothetical protein
MGQRHYQAPFLPEDHALSRFDCYRTLVMPTPKVSEKFTMRNPKEAFF